MIELDKNEELITKIAVVGVGGAGCNAIKNLINFGTTDVELIAINTDMKQLRAIPASVKVVIGKELTRGQGAGSNPEIGRKAAEADFESIREFLMDKDMVFVTAGMGGGTGSGAAPIVAKAAKENDSLVVAIVVTPLKNEGSERWENAFKGLENLRENVDGLIIVSNEKLSNFSRDQKLSVKKAFEQADRVVYDATKGIIDLINSVGIINVDFADVKTVIKGKGDALIGKGFGDGENRAIEAVESALNSPLLEGIYLKEAQSALVNITFGEDFYHYEVDQILNRIREATNENLNIIHGLVDDSSLGSSVSVTVVITGFKNTFLAEYLDRKKQKMKDGNSNVGKEEFVYFTNKTRKLEIPEPQQSNFKLSHLSNSDSSQKDLKVPAYTRKMKLLEGVENVDYNFEVPISNEPYLVRNIDDNSNYDENQNKEDKFLLVEKKPAIFRKILD